MNCKNCGDALGGKFCSACGQSAQVSRINFPNFIHEVTEGVFQVNRGFFFTLRELFLRPGNTLNEFLEGKRKNHFKPVAYVLTWSTLYFLIAQITNQTTWMDDVITGWMNGATEHSKSEQLPKSIIWLSKNYAYATLFLLPVFSLSTYLAFWRFGKNYFEHLVINCYITGQQAIIYCLFAILYALVHHFTIESISFFASITYFFWVFWQLFSNGSRLKNILRSLLTHFLYLLFVSLLLLILLVISRL
ncbi:DUF3667 domain-containing protein [Algoriphagus litoralis]|uniref:DUF3667 domain-containing protein n=1 Tax=Algoriphagus litoralis TaxID=2202829 RepID=UPI000DBA490E|nr:DUF3667 domain-containing protein [Algoriphagus litoralis]